jgi:hypothetical protein
MPPVIQQRLQTAVFLAACDICCQPQPLISHRMLADRFEKTGIALLKKNGLLPADNLRYVSAPQGDDEVGSGDRIHGRRKIRLLGRQRLGLRRF